MVVGNQQVTVQPQDKTYNWNLRYGVGWNLGIGELNRQKDQEWVLIRET